MSILKNNKCLYFKHDSKAICQDDFGAYMIGGENSRSFAFVTDVLVRSRSLQILCGTQREGRASFTTAANLFSRGSLISYDCQKVITIDYAGLCARQVYICGETRFRNLISSLLLDILATTCIQKEGAVDSAAPSIAVFYRTVNNTTRVLLINLSG